MSDYKFLFSGERALIVEFGTTIDETINAHVHHTAHLIKKELTAQVIEIVPTYRSLAVYFDPLRISRAELINSIQHLLANKTGGDKTISTRKVIHIPVCYEGEFAPDLDFVARHNVLRQEEVIRIHTSTPYLIYMLGFTPGFPYLGGMSPKIAAPRLEQPRTKIPAGSVGIAGGQTGFYPVESPGGWRLIGRTPIRAFDPDSEQPFMFAAGDYLKFEAITMERYREIEQEVKNRCYQPVFGSF